MDQLLTMKEICFKDMLNILVKNIGKEKGISFKIFFWMIMEKNQNNGHSKIWKNSTQKVHQ